ncbi:MAG: proline dehydrogenase family protein, partial [Gemmatimonadales bacterium]
RLVKGAYKEPPEVAYPRKRDVDENFMRLAKRLLSENGRRAGQCHGFGTHDLDLLARVGDYADGAGLAKDAYEIQMLYGIKRDAQVQFAARG